MGKMKLWQKGLIFGAMWGFLATILADFYTGFGIISAILGIPVIIGGGFGVLIAMIPIIAQCGNDIACQTANLPPPETLMLYAIIPSTIIGAIFGAIIGYIVKKVKK